MPVTHSSQFHFETKIHVKQYFMLIAIYIHNHILSHFKTRSKIQKNKL